MKDIQQDPESVETRPVKFSAAVVLVAMVISLVTTLLLLLSGRGSVPLYPGDKAWELSVPEDVHTLELGIFSHQTDAEREAGRDRERLASYGWVDQKRRRVHIPISVAIELNLAERAEP